MQLINRLTTRVRFKYKDIYHNLEPLIRIIRPFKGTIICYHGVDLKGSTKYNSKFIAKDSLKKQFLFFKKHFTVVPLEEYIKKIKDSERNNLLAITFDDGYKNNIKYLLPLVEELQFPISIFITGIRRNGQEALLGDLYDLAAYHCRSDLNINDTMYVRNFRGHLVRKEDRTPLKRIFHEKDYKGKRQILDQLPKYCFEFLKSGTLNDYWQQLSKEEIRELSRSKYITIGAHSMNHDNLNLLPLSQARETVLSSINYLEAIIEKKVVDFALPYGAYNKELVQSLKDTKLRTILALNYNSSFRDDILYPRAVYNPYISWKHQVHSFVNFKHE